MKKDLEKLVKKKFKVFINFHICRVASGIYKFTCIRIYISYIGCI